MEGGYGHLAGEERFVRPEHHGIVRGTYRAYIHGLSERDPEPAALPHGVVFDTSVLAKHPAVPVHERAGYGGSSGEALYHGGVVPIGNKADVLTVRLGGVDKAVFRGNGAHPVLGEPP